MEISLRAARKEDAEFVAMNVMRSVKEDALPVAWMEAMTEICAREDTLYSYKHTCILEADGVPAGSLTAYDGAIYAESRELSFGLFAEKTGNVPARTEAETGSGEFYLDSLGVLPEYRGMGFGRVLIRDALSRAEARGFHLITLIVEANRTHLISYYSSLGFQRSSPLTFLGEQYVRMVQEL